MKPREVVAGPFGVGNVWRTHADLTRELLRNDEMPFEPKDCPGSLVIYANDGVRPILTECDRCGTEVSFRQSVKPTDPEPRQFEPDSEIPL